MILVNTPNRQNYDIDLVAQYDAAMDEWYSSGQADEWEAVLADGLVPVEQSE